MKITDIKPQIKKQDRFSVFIDGKFAFGLDAVDVLYYKLKIDDEISRERYEEILEDSIYDKAKNTAVRFLGYRARSRKELKDRLLRDYDEQICEKVLSMLEKYGYINDEDFAASYVKDCLNIKGWGEKRIFIELMKKGVSRDIAEKILSNAAEPQIEQIEKLLTKRLKGRKNIDYREKKKHFDFLIRRGYTTENIKAVFERVFSDIEWQD